MTSGFFEVNIDVLHVEKGILHAKIFLRAPAGRFGVFPGFSLAGVTYSPAKGIYKMQKLRCHSCRKELPKGSLKYIIEIRSLADFDGYLEEYEGDIEEGLNELLLDTVEDIDAKTLEEDVSRELIFILCKNCRDRFISDPFQTGRAIFEGEDVKGTIH